MITLSVMESARVIVNTRNLKTKDGTLVVEMTQAFIDKVRRHFELSVDEDLTDEHVKNYVWHVVDVAVAKAERCVV